VAQLDAEFDAAELTDEEKLNHAISHPDLLDLDARAAAAHASVAVILAPLVLLGPSRVSTLWLEWQQALERGDDHAADEAELGFRDAAQRELGADDDRSQWPGRP
jgi:hypothetical protein